MISLDEYTTLEAYCIKLFDFVNTSEFIKLSSENQVSVKNEMNQVAMYLNIVAQYVERDKNDNRAIIIHVHDENHLNSTVIHQFSCALSASKYTGLDVEFIKKTCGLKDSNIKYKINYLENANTILDFSGDRIVYKSIL